MHFDYVQIYSGYLALFNHISLSAASYFVPNVYSHNSSRILNSHMPPSVSLSVIGLETGLIVWMSALLYKLGR